MVNDGTYVILSAKNTETAIDSRGDTDNNGANVWLYHRNDGDGQLVRITTNSDGSRRMIFALSGKSIDVSHDFVSGANVQQWEDGDYRSQKWTITADGKTASVRGIDYDSYVIALTASPSLVLDVTAGQAVSGTNIQIYTSNATDAQRWIFVEKNPVPTGTYVIRSLIDPKAVLDVSGQSLASGANISLWGFNGQNNQIWRVEEYNESGLACIYCTHSGKCLNVYENLAADGQNVQQWQLDYTGACFWVIAPNGTTKINGVTVPVYTLRFLTGSGYAVDAQGRSSEPGTNVQIWTYNGSDAQKWIFEPYSALEEALPVPASIMCGITAGKVIGSTIEATDIKTIYPSWICQGIDYQARYRLRLRSIGKEIDDWSDWKSIADGTTANNGYGDVGVANCITNDTIRKYSPTGISVISVDNLTYDYEEVQIDVRRYEADYNGITGLHAHGNSATGSIKLIWKATLTITEALWTVDGLKITYVSDYKRGGNTIIVNKIYSGSNTLCEKSIYTALPYSGSFIIPVSEMKIIPTENESITIDLTIMTDVVSAESSSQLSVVYNSSHGITVSPSYTINDNFTVTAEITSHASDICYVWTGEEYYQCDVISVENGKKKFLIIPPLNVPWQVFFMSSEGTSWGTHIDTKAALICKWHIWNWNGNTAVIGINKDDPPAVSITTTPDSEKQVTTGRKYPVFSFTASREKDLSISGTYVKDLLEYSSEEIYEKLEDAHHAIYRSPLGKWYTVAITEISFTHHYDFGGWGDVSIKQEAESL